MHKIVRRFEIWEGNRTGLHYIVDPKTSEFWDTQVMYLCSYDVIACIVRDTLPEKLSYKKATAAMTFITEALITEALLNKPTDADRQELYDMGDEEFDTPNLTGASVTNIEPPSEIAIKAHMKSVTSDGGSSDYYKLKLRLDANCVTTVDDQTVDVTLETGDVIRVLVGNDFNLGNAVKALRRIYEASEGRGKEGVDIAYDIKKIKYFLDDWDKAVKRGKK